MAFPALARRACATIATAELQRLKPFGFGWPDVVAEVTTYQDSRDASQASGSGWIVAA
jgi:hypothetical protein